MKTKRNAVKTMLTVIAILFLFVVGVVVVDWLIFPAYKACWDCVAVRPAG